MTFFIKLSDSLEKHFEKGSKLEKFYPLFEAFQSFLLSTKHVATGRVHVRDSLDTKRYMSIVILALKPCLAFGIYNAGYQLHKATGLDMGFVPVVLSGLKLVLPIVIVSYAVGLFWEFVFSVVRGHEVNEGFLVTGLLYPLILPPDIPLWMVAVGVSFGVVIGKEVFGGTGRNFLNPALTARAFLFFTYPAYMSGDVVWTAISASKDKLIDGFSGATALSVAAATQAPASVTQTLVEHGYSWSTLFWGFIPGSIGETSAFCVLIGAVVLLVTGIGSWRTMVSCVAGVFVMSSVLGFFATATSLPILTLPPLWHFVMGGFAFGTVFMATDPVSSPGLDCSKYIYGFLIGALAVIIRCINPAYPEGMMLAILLMNVFAPLIDHVVLQRKVHKRIPNVI